MVAPQFVRFVSSVPGRLVTRWDNPATPIGARVSTAEERTAGAEPIVWDEERVTPFTADFAARFDRELRGAFARGDLVERQRADWEAWTELEQKREADRARAVADVETETEEKS